jgi:hypothetical protein
MGNNWDNEISALDEMMAENHAGIALSHSLIVIARL